MLKEIQTHALEEEIKRRKVEQYWAGADSDDDAWMAVNSVVKRRGGKGLDINEYCDREWAYDYMAGGCGVPG